MRKRLLPALLFLALFPSISYACLCGGYAPFCAFLSEQDYIMLARVTDKLQGYNMEIEIIENYQNEVDTSSLRVLGQDGLNCGETLSLFDLNDTIILALDNEDYRDAQMGENYEWFLSGCGRRYLNYSNGNVYGPIREGTDSISLQEFQEGLAECVLTSNAHNEASVENSLFTIFPNPASDFLYVNVALRSNKRYRYDILNTNGQVIKSNLSINQQFNEVDISTLPSNQLYFLRARSSDEILVSKFLKQ